ncbi:MULTISPECIES: hypothetical protein [Sphingobacterium]|uniref:hypothetical protein n=1 Tax=Sphingobacterium TaxID=28453 RepID=UPI00105288F4|nr:MULTISPECIES: hypothetical protein [Sphingobacterium]MCW2264012.1 hypothetical protein [Sphingobacterium kitahiroshimense]TCR15003.1 hypothetical protein EDF67_1011110 [Sphingobacterium sp. JUb78]
MKRKTIILVIVLALIAFFLFGVKYETIIYLGMSSSTSDGYSIDAQVKIDGELITKDSINNNPYKYKTIKKKLGIGFRKVEILSVKADVYSTETLLIFPNQFILMEFLPATDMNKKIIYPQRFDIANGFNPFYYE